MTAPNLKNPTIITGKTARVGIATTAVVGILTNSAASNKVLKVNKLIAIKITLIRVYFRYKSCYILRIQYGLFSQFLPNYLTALARHTMCAQ